MRKNINKIYITLLIIFTLFISINKVSANTESNLLKVTTKNYTNFSTDKNFIIFVVDAIDSKKFDKVFKSSKYKDNFKDFTYYPDTLSHYLYTRESIPLIISGNPNYNEDDYLVYYNKAFDNSKFLDRLITDDYEINIYDHELNWTTKKARVTQNIKFLFNEEEGIMHPVKCALKKVGYKYIPFIFNIMPSLKFENCDESVEEEVNLSELFSWDNIDNYKYILNMPVTFTDKKQFKFIHTNGVHPPYNMDGELNRVNEKNSSETKEMQASLKLLSSYIDLLKTNNVYDNTVIIITADHGYNNGERMGKQNPILYIKGINETNDSLNISDKKVSHLDLSDAYLKLLDGEKARDLFQEFTSNRVRKLIWYVFRKENHMVEYTLDGHAWEVNKLKKTGKEFNR
ncbi:MAG: sulfatase-like hydrolase/transferase [Bacilli bacterium]|nr:sulfatase-like hydrolase/transferase [Bacilli bacterium]